MANIRVCIVLEGSYPFITGGVSAWVHDLINNLPEIDFCLFTISPDDKQTLHYELPANIVEHVDVVLSDTKPPKHMPKIEKDKLLQMMEGLHTRMYSGDAPNLAKMIGLMPEGYFMYEDAMKEEKAWQMIVDSNQQKNPIYPFSDYFWAWKSAHDLIFRVLGASPPEADIYHAVSTGFAGIASLAAQVRRQKPFLLTEHGLYHKEREIEIRKASFVKGYQRDMWTKIYNKLSAICYKSADYITALFEENRQKQIDLGAPAERCFVVPNGIDIERYSSVTREDRPGFHVGLVGRVVPIKDIKTFISAAKICIEEIEDVHFHCIGPTDEDPGYYEDCKLLVESLQITDSFTFTGRQNVLEYYSFLDVMVLTSVREAQPLVILEAWSAGVPVVSTRVGNVPEMLDYDDRFLANSKDAEKIASGIKYYHDHPEETALLMQKNKKKVNELYNKKDLHQKFHEIYTQLKAEE
jgi:glycosyltransferase involved in cell wall biosynthesis